MLTGPRPTRPLARSHARPSVSLDAVCIDGKFLPTIVERFGRRWVVLNARLIRALGLSSYPAGSVAHEISSAVAASRGNRSILTRRTGPGRVPRPVTPVEVRGKTLEVMNNLWPVCVAPEDLEWALGELHGDAQAAREITRTSNLLASVGRPGLF